jgi:hypothetical protein
VFATEKAKIAIQKIVLLALFFWGRDNFHRQPFLKANGEHFLKKWTLSTFS